MSRARLRLATVVSASCLVAAGGLAIAALVVGRSGDRPVSAPAATLAVAPSTVAPATRTPRSAPDDGRTTEVPATAAASSVPPPPSTSTLPLSPLATMVGEAVSVEPPPLSESPVPVRLTIDALGVDVPVRPVGVEPDGQLEIPDETEVGWYRLGAAPGETGASVLAGHVNWNRVDGPFVRLVQLEPGAAVTVTLADGSARRYQVVERQQYGKTALPAERIWTTAGPETLVLITCGGSFNPDIRRYRDNIVVYAVPVA